MEGVLLLVKRCGASIVAVGALFYFTSTGQEDEARFATSVTW